LKIKTKTQILTDDEVQELSRRLTELLPPKLVAYSQERGFTTETTIRMSSLAARFEEARVARGQSIKDVAAQLRVPQYRIRAVEQGHASEIVPEVLAKYSAFLDLDRWCKRWATANRQLGIQLALIPDADDS